jgi:hypothetical protein
MELYTIMLQMKKQHKKETMMDCIYIYIYIYSADDRLCGLVDRVLGYRSGGPGSSPGATRKKSSGSGTESTQPREYN